jgi:hypothetical protein
MHESRIANQIEKVYKFRDPACHWRHKLKYVFDFDLLVDQTFLKIISEKIKRGLIFFFFGCVLISTCSRSSPTVLMVRRNLQILISTIVGVGSNQRHRLIVAIVVGGGRGERRQ